MFILFISVKFNRKIGLIKSPKRTINKVNQNELQKTASEKYNFKSHMYKYK